MDRFSCQRMAHPSFIATAWLITVGVAGVLSCLTAAARAQVYEPTGIYAFGGDASFAHAINDNGVVVGYARNELGENRAFIYQNGTVNPLGTLGGTASQAFAINNNNDVVGFSRTLTGVEHAFRYSSGTMTDLGTLGGSSSYGFGINDAGDVVGGATTPFDLEYRAFLQSGGTTTDLGLTSGFNHSSEALGIDTDGTVVGWTTLPNFDQRGFVFRDGSMTTLITLGGDYGYANAIRNGVIVGGAYEEGNVAFRAVRWSDGTITNLGTLPNLPSSTAYALNGTGQIVGKSDAGSDETSRAFIHLGGASATMLDLNDLIAPGSGWTLQQARGINDAGQIVGFGTFNGQNRGFVLDMTGKLWANAAGGAFVTGENWFSTGAPTSSHSAMFALDATYTVNIAPNVSSKSIDVARGNVTFDFTAARYDVTQNLVVRGGATLRAIGSGSIDVGGTLGISGGSRLIVGTDGLYGLKVGAVTISEGGAVDLVDNEMQVRGGNSYDEIAALIASGRNLGAWDGPGITSSAARDRLVSNTTLGALSGSEYLALYGDAPFAGAAVAAGDVLIMYTYYGDTDFNGIINFDDYARVDAGFNTGLTGWFNGDFDLNGVINFDDYALIDLSFNTQSGSLLNGNGELTGVPEPSSFLALLCSVLFGVPRPGKRS